MEEKIYVEFIYLGSLCSQLPVWLIRIIFCLGGKTSEVLGSQSPLELIAIANYYYKWDASVFRYDLQSVHGLWLGTESLNSIMVSYLQVICLFSKTN